MAEPGVYNAIITRELPPEPDPLVPEPLVPKPVVVRKKK